MRESNCTKESRCRGLDVKVLIALDESECSQRALESVMERQWPADSEFRVVSVHEPLRGYDPMIYAPRSIESITEIDKEFYAAKRSMLKKGTEKLKSKIHDCSISWEILTGPPQECILDEAKHWGANLIVVGSHGRKGFSKAFFGSVAAAIASQADCSVEIVK